MDCIPKICVNLRNLRFICLIGFLSSPLAWCRPLGAETPATVEHLGDEGFGVLKEIYNYDATIPLEARTVEKALKEKLEREKVVFRGAMGFLVPGYLQFPPERIGPVPCVLLLHGWSGSKQDWWIDDNYIKGGNVRKALLESGYAVFALDAQCHGDRISVND
jgi:hypothetical protein